jgi:hypothetical protein
LRQKGLRQRYGTECQLETPDRAAQTPDPTRVLSQNLLQADGSIFGRERISGSDGRSLRPSQQRRVNAHRPTRVAERATIGGKLEPNRLAQRLVAAAGDDNENWAMRKRATREGKRADKEDKQDGRPQHFRFIVKLRLLLDTGSFNPSDRQ